MQLELSELLICPACGSTAGLVVSVERMEQRRVRNGSLSCPSCDERFPVRGGHIDFRTGTPDAGGPGPRADPGDPSRRALHAAALLDLREGGGVVLLGRGLARSAAALSDLVPSVEVLAVEDPAVVAEEESEGATGEEAPRAADEEEGPGSPAARRVTRLLGAGKLGLPLRPGRLRGVALLHGSEAELEEACRVVSPGGRIVVFAPPEEVVTAVRGLPLQLVAEEPAALVVVRGEA